MDVVIEVLLEVFLELFFLIVPEKRRSKGYRAAAVITATLLLAAVFALVIWGGVLLVDHKSKLGILPIAFAAVISLAVIVAGIINYNKNH